SAAPNGRTNHNQYDQSDSHLWPQYQGDLHERNSLDAESGSAAQQREQGAAEEGYGSSGVRRPEKTSQERAAERKSPAESPKAGDRQGGLVDQKVFDGRCL